MWWKFQVLLIAGNSKINSVNSPSLDLQLVPRSFPFHRLSLVIGQELLDNACHRENDQIFRVPEFFGK